jgi:hypothetical protein
MRKRITTTLVALGVLGAFGGGVSGVAMAQHGADDPAGHQRHNGADDGARHHRHHHHHRHHRRGGRDDGPNHG